MHPVGVAPHGTTIPDGWPLESGLVTCATCHAEPAHAGVDLPSPWHRGGPYPVTLELCGQCHDLSRFRRQDPHHPADPKDPHDPSCAACHAGTPEKGALIADANLRTNPSGVCGVCHPSPVHTGEKEHVGRPTTTAIPWPLAPDGTISCFTCHDVHRAVGGAYEPSRMGNEIRTRARADEWQELPGGARLPGDARPHPSLLSAGLEKDALCTACHGVDP
jgi:hypothetical protein